MWQSSTSAWEITNEHEIRHISRSRCQRQELRGLRGPFPRRGRQRHRVSHVIHARTLSQRGRARLVLNGRRRPFLKPAAAILGPSQDAAVILRACATPAADIAEEYRRSDPEQVPGHPFAVPGLPDDGP